MTSREWVAGSGSVRPAGIAAGILSRTDVPRPSSSRTGRAAAARLVRRALARLRTAIERAIARAARRRPRHHLGGLPAHLLRDMGIDRPEIVFVAVFGRFSVRRDDGFER